MTTIQNILFPVDFSPSCIAMAAYVKRSAAMFSAKVTLVHVLDLYSPSAHVPRSSQSPIGTTVLSPKFIYELISFPK